MRMKHRVGSLVTRLKRWLIKKLGGHTIETVHRTEFKYLHGVPIKLKSGAEFFNEDFILMAGRERKIKMKLLEPMLDAILEQMYIERSDDLYSHSVRFCATLLVLPREDTRRLICPEIMIERSKN